MAKDGLQDAVARNAAKLLMGAYERQKQKSWAALAKRYELNKARCYRIAHGTLKPNPAKDLALMRALSREGDIAKRPVKLRRLIQRIGVAYLAKRQRSSIGIYGAGGRPITEKG